MKTLKNLILLVILLAPTFSIAQEMETRKLPPFNQILVDGRFNTFIEYGNEESVKIQSKGIDPKKIITEVKNGHLKVYIDKQNDRNVRATIFIIYKSLESIDKTGSGNLICQSDISANIFTLSSSGSGDIVFNKQIKAQHLNVSNSGSGDVKLTAIEATNLHSSLSGSGGISISSGQVKTHAIDASGSGGIRAFGVRSDKCSLSTSNSSSAEITVEQTLEVTASGSGEIYYKGNAQLTKVSTSGSTNIKKIN
jgi:frataxin-like iron-binding protein CyaY